MKWLLALPAWKRRLPRLQPKSCSWSSDSTRVSPLRYNLTLLGPPGGGKGFYGKRWADGWQVPLYTASAILQRNAANHVLEHMNRGKLVDDGLVSDLVLNQVQHGNRRTGYILDGFPRTRRQIEIMGDWPDSHRVQAAIHLDVPDQVCVAKIQGRRYCTICHEHWNVAHVKTSCGFSWPAIVPQQQEKRCSCSATVCQLDSVPTSLETAVENTISEPKHWIRRTDDMDATVVLHRLQQYRERHEQPILEYFRSNQRLLSLQPFNGAKDVPQMKRTIEQWLHTRLPHAPVSNS
jgi:adenylate kinase